MTAPHINTLREHLMGTLASLRDRENPMEPDRARAVAQVAGVLVDTAKVEVRKQLKRDQVAAFFANLPLLDRRGGVFERAPLGARAAGLGAHRSERCG